VSRYRQYRAFNCLIDSMSMSPVSSFIAYLLLCNSGDHRQSGVVSTILALGRVTPGYAKRMLSVAVSALETRA
jgi:hypothetical protein